MRWNALTVYAVNSANAESSTPSAIVNIAIILSVFFLNGIGTNYLVRYWASQYLNRPVSTGIVEYLVLATVAFPFADLTSGAAGLTYVWDKMNPDDVNLE